MKHYRLLKGTKIVRWNGTSWWDFVTTLDAYYTENDVIKNVATPESTRLKVPDQKWTMISVLSDSLLSACAECGIILAEKEAERCIICEATRQR